MTRPRVAAAVGLALVYGQLFAASFVVPPDREFIQRAPAIAVGSVLESHTALNDKNGIETITTFSIEETIKGPFDGDTITIYEPGGVYGNRAAFFPGVPRFEDGERYLLFLARSDDGHWHVLDIALGKFHFATDTLGHDVLLRDMRDVVAFDPKGGRHRESNRAAEPFLNFVRGLVRGGPTRDDYLIPAEPLVAPPSFAPKLPGNGHLKPRLLSTPLAVSYDADFGSGNGARWASFPPVNFGSIGSVTGAPGSPAGSTAITTAFNAWNSVSGASINYHYTGNDSSGTTNVPNTAGDGKNTIAFEYDLNACCSIANFSCSGGGYSGVLGLGGVTSATTPFITFGDGSQFYQTKEGDVWMNKGIAGCTLLLTTYVGDWNSAVTHETGHTLGWRHSDQTRADNPAIACSTDATLECSSSAIMTAVVTSMLNAAPQTWDQHAAVAVYPSTGPPPVTSVAATATSTTNVQVTWSGSCSTTCHIYRTANNSTYTQVGSGASPFPDSTAAPGVAYLYKVRAYNGSAESTDSNLALATTVIYTNTITAGTIIHVVDINQMRDAVDAVRALDGIGAGAYTYGSGSPQRIAAGTVVHAADINELRMNLNTAWMGLFGTTPTYTNTINAGSTVVHAVDFNEIRTLMR